MRPGLPASPPAAPRGDREPAEVGDVLAQRQPAVHVQAVERPRTRRTARRAPRRAASNSARSSSVHQSRSGRGVELAALVVEAVRDLVADDRADGAVVHGVVGVGVEERRLQDARREDDLVEQRVVVGVHLVGWHRPLAPIDGLVQSADLPRELERAQRIRFSAKDPRLNEPGVVAPLVREADLYEKPRASAGPPSVASASTRHPDRAPHRAQQPLDHLLAALLGLRRERGVDVELRHQFADVRGSGVEHALPARLHLLLAAQRAAVEGERFELELRPRGPRRRPEPGASGGSPAGSRRECPRGSRPAPRRTPGCPR